MNKKNKKYIGFGERPSDKDFFKITKTQYDATPEQNIGNYELILNTPTVKAYLDRPVKTIMLSIRGTTDGRDVGADAMIPLNRLKYSNRYNEDKNIIANLINEYSPEDYDYYGTGHSLGSALLRQLQREFPFIKNTVTFNGAVQPYDIVDQKTNLNKSYYTEEDALYKLGGRLLNNKVVIPSTVHTLKVPGFVPLPSSVKIGQFGYNASQGHKLDNFEGVLGGFFNPLSLLNPFSVPPNPFKQMIRGSSCCMCHVKHIVRGGAIEERKIESLEDFSTTELRKIASIFNKFFKIKLTKLKRDEILRELKKYIYLNESGSIFVNEDDLFFSLKPKEVIKEFENKKKANKLKKEEKPKTRKEILEKEKVSNLKSLLISLGDNPKGLTKYDIIGRILMIEFKNKKDKLEEPKILLNEKEEFEKNENYKKILYIYDLIIGPNGLQKINDNINYIKKQKQMKKYNIDELENIFEKTEELIDLIDSPLNLGDVVDNTKFDRWYKNNYPEDYKNLPSRYINQNFQWIDKYFTNNEKQILKSLLNKKNIEYPDFKQLKKELEATNKK